MATRLPRFTPPAAKDAANRLALASNCAYVNLQPLHTRAVFSGDLAALSSKNDSTCMTISCLVRLEAAFYKARQSVNRVQVVRNQVLVMQLDPILLFQKGDELHDPGGINDAPLQKRVAICEAIANLAKHEVVCNEPSQFVIKRHTMSSCLQSDL